MINIIYQASVPNRLAPNEFAQLTPVPTRSNLLNGAKFSPGPICYIPTPSPAPVSYFLKVAISRGNIYKEKVIKKPTSFKLGNRCHNRGIERICVVKFNA